MAQQYIKKTQIFSLAVVYSKCFPRLPTVYLKKKSTANKDTHIGFVIEISISLEF